MMMMMNASNKRGQLTTKGVVLERKKISHRQLGSLRGSSSPFQHFEPARVKPN